MTLQLVYDEYCRMNAGQKTCSYSSFCRRYADKKPNWEPQDLFTNLHYVTGDVMEIDFAGDCQANDKLTYLLMFVFSAHSEESSGRMAVSCPGCVLYPISLL